MEKTFVRDSDPALNAMRHSNPEEIAQDFRTRYKVHESPHKRKPDLEDYDSKGRIARISIAMLVHGTLRGNHA